LPTLSYTIRQKNVNIFFWNKVKRVGFLSVAETAGRAKKMAIVMFLEKIT